MCCTQGCTLQKPAMQWHMAPSGAAERCWWLLQTQTLRSLLSIRHFWVSNNLDVLTCMAHACWSLSTWQGWSSSARVRLIWHLAHATGRRCM